MTATGLAALGKPAGYVERQVKGWTERYLAAKTDEVPEIEAAAAWAAGHMPPESGVALVHNDYKYDNVVLDPADLDPGGGGPRLGDGHHRRSAHGPGDDARLLDRPRTTRRCCGPSAFGPTHLPGSLSRREVVARYAERSGRAVDDVLFHYVFALFKLAVIVQQIYRRYVDGHTSDPRFAPLIHMVRVLGTQAARALDRGASTTWDASSTSS